MATEREIFKAAFLRRCADAGLSIEETHACVKQALETVKEAAGSVLTRPIEKGMDVVGDLAKNVGNIGLTGLLVGPGLAGMAAGYGASRLSDIDDEDVDSFKQRELIDAYRQYAERIRRSQQRRVV